MSQERLFYYITHPRFEAWVASGSEVIARYAKKSGDVKRAMSISVHGKQYGECLPFAGERQAQVKDWFTFRDWWESGMKVRPCSPAELARLNACTKAERLRRALRADEAVVAIPTSERKVLRPHGRQGMAIRVEGSTSYPPAWLYRHVNKHDGKKLWEVVDARGKKLSWMVSERGLMASENGVVWVERTGVVR